MALIERIMHWDTEPENRWISVHEFFAAQNEVVAGRITVNQVKTYYNMTAEDISEYDALIALKPGTATGNINYVQQFHSIFILAEHKVPGYSTPVDVRSKLGI